jgi:hypothetical protein
LPAAHPNHSSKHLGILILLITCPKKISLDKEERKSREDSRKENKEKSEKESKRPDRRSTDRKSSISDHKSSDTLEPRRKPISPALTVASKNDSPKRQSNLDKFVTSSSSRPKTDSISLDDISKKLSEGWKLKVSQNYFFHLFTLYEFFILLLKNTQN